MKMSFVSTELTQVQNYLDLKKNAEKLPVNYGGLKRHPYHQHQEDALLTHVVRF